MDLAGTVATLPAGRGDGTVSVDFGRLARSEARMEELAFVTRDKAPELARAMNRGWLDVSTDLLVVKRNLRWAQEGAAKRKAQILLYEVPRILVERGIPTANAEIREAILVQDGEYQRLKEVQDQWEALDALLKIKAQGFRNVFEAVKKVLGGGLGPSGGGDRDLSHAPGGGGLPPVTSYQTIGTSCPVCDLPQYATPTGAVCAQGHGI